MRSCDPTRTSPAVPLATLDRLVLDAVLGGRVVLGRLPHRTGRWALRRRLDARHAPPTVADLCVRRPLGLPGTPAARVRVLPVTVPGAREPALVDDERRPAEGAFAVASAGVGPR
ncbi:hypothetical protein PUR59_24835 [Streptomyces sp. SP18ES09]|uniref:hypothetical protein n=1 Tax=Streptomyces sp. SP18ES09 TaxID=3002532 RepID=UPI002E76A2DF|nr:hypothetical protein [Streptomyces sp. SP18ES09]MEE1818229.1 hypothetical protein [Streptomyces sp. SP18ES09]